MDIDGFWNVVGAARAESSGSHGQAFAEALVDQLARLSQEEIRAADPGSVVSESDVRA